MNTPTVTLVADQDDFDNASVRLHPDSTGDHTIVAVEVGGITIQSSTRRMTVEQFASELHNLADRIVLADAARSNHPEKIIEHAIKAAS